MKAQRLQTTTPKVESIISLIAGIRESANLLIETELQRRGLSGIVPAHGAVLQFLFLQEGTVPIKSVVEESGRVKSTVTGIVNTLERHGYVFKQGCDMDARSVRVGLTEKGWALKQDFVEISALLLNRLYGEMPQEERHQLVALLSVLEKNLA